MDIEKELDEIFDDPLLDIDEKEKELFDIPQDMQKVMSERERPDYVARRKICEDFEEFRPLFAKVADELRQGVRKLKKVSKTYNFQKGQFYIVSGQMTYIADTGQLVKIRNGSLDGRTRCIYDNGTESDIMLQTLRKNVVGDGYLITEPNEETCNNFFTVEDLKPEDKVTGMVYVLRSKSQNPAIAEEKDLYKIGFTTTPVSQRIANAQHEPTYLMADVEIVETYKVVNISSQKVENLLHYIFGDARFHTTVYDDNGEAHHPKEWFVVPLEVIGSAMEKLVDGTIINYAYNAVTRSLEQVNTLKKYDFQAHGYKVLTLNIKKCYFDEILKGEKTIEYREVKQTTLNRYTVLNKEDGKRYIRPYDLIRFYVGYHRDRESALVQIKSIRFNEGYMEYELGMILDVTK